jgi:hypothetical protein
MWKKLLSGLGLIIVLIASVIGGRMGEEIGNLAFTPKQLTQEQIDKEIYDSFSKTAEQENAKGPVMIDPDTRLDRLVAGPGPRLTYLYSFPAYSLHDFDSEWILDELQPEVKRGVCGSQEMKPSLQYGATYIYSYTGNDGVEIGRFEINKNDCGY